MASVCDALELAGVDVVRRDWLATDAMISAVPGIAKHRGLKAVVDIKSTRRGRMARGSTGY